MIHLVRAELTKLRTIWSTWILLGVTLVATGLLGLLVGLAPHRRGLAALVFPARGTHEWYVDIFSSAAIAQDFALVLGILIVTGEYRHKTVTPTYLGEPRRGRVVTAKLLVSAGAGLAVTFCAAVGAFVLGVAMVGVGYGHFTEMGSTLWQLVPGVCAASVLYGVYGLGLGSLLKNQVVALVVGLGLTAVVEPIIVAVWPAVGRYLPSEAAKALETRTTLVGGGLGSNVHLLTTLEGALVLVAYGVVLAAAGSLTTLRADVT